MTTRSLVTSDLRFVLLAALGLALFPFLLHPLGGYAGLATQILIVSVASIAFNLLQATMAPWPKADPRHHATTEEQIADVKAVSVVLIGQICRS